MTAATLNDLKTLLPAADPPPLLRLSLRTLTPLYLGGTTRPRNEKDPDPKKTYTAQSEQAGSVPGIIHWWLRALLGSCVDQDGNYIRVGDMKKLEDRVLGATKWSPQRSIALNIEGRPEEHGKQWEEAVDKHRHFHVRTTMKRYNSSRGHYDADTPLMVDIQSVAEANLSSDQLRSSPEAMALAGAIWCWATLGSMGTRSRHGYGALHLDGVEGTLAEAFAASCKGDVNEVWLPPATPEKWEAFAMRGLIGALGAAKKLAGTEFQPTSVQDFAARKMLTADKLPGWSSFAPAHWYLGIVSEPKPRTKKPHHGGSAGQGLQALQLLLAAGPWADALEAIEKRLNAYLNNAGDDETLLGLLGVSGYAAPSTPLVLKNLEFGLPRCWSPKGGRRVCVEGPGGPGIRRSSPLLSRPVSLGVDKQGNIEYGLLFLMFRADFWKDDPLTVPAGNPSPTDVATPDPMLSHLEGFMRSVQDDPRKVAWLPEPLPNPTP